MYYIFCLNCMTDIENYNFVQHIEECNENLYENYTYEGSYEYYSDLAERLGNVEIGLDKEDIEVASTIIEKEKIDDVCSICLDIFENKIRKLICNHIFCDECINTWLQKSKKCPCCLINLEDEIKKKNLKRIIKK